MTIIDQETPASELDSPPKAPTSGDRGPLGNPWMRLVAAVFVVAAAGVAGWFFLHNSGTTPKAKRAPANTASASALASLATTLGHPVYWAGPKAGYTYELTHTTDGRIYIRYLPAGVAVGAAAPNYLTVGTYPVTDAIGTVRAIGHKPGGSLFKVAGGGVAAVDPDHPLSTYVAYPGSAYEVEVYAPSADQSRQLVAAGGLVPAGTGSASTFTPVKPTLATMADIQALATSSGHAIYWAGKQAGANYELSELSNGRIYVRYLPKGVIAGAAQPFPTVGTYPVQQALAAVKTIALQPGATKIQLSNGGIAVIDPAHPTSVYIAYPHSNLEIEVFNPSAATAKQLVTSGVIVPVV
jgi:hypothetical protein